MSTTATSTTFRIDPLHPTALLCESCGEPVCSLPGDAVTPEYVKGLTTHQAAIRWREQGAAIQLHAALCQWRRTYPKADVPAYVRVTEGEAD
jgi:hypothetical protein